MTNGAPRHPTLLLAWKIGSITVGSLLILLGLVMLVTPGPGWLAIFGGLAMLSPHSVWAKAILSWLKKKLRIRSRKKGGQSPGGAETTSKTREDRKARM